ncbi:MAG: MFS transporter, partial [Elusimicrobiota bacterium]
MARGPLLLRDRDMLLVWSGQSLSQAGTRLYQIALAWWIVSRGGGGREVGLFMAAGALPALLLIGAVGRVVDRTSSRRVLVLCDLAAFAVSLCAALAFRYGRFGFWGACLAGLLLAAAQAFFDPALNKAVSEAAAPEDLEEAVSLQSSTQSLASFGGAVAGALLIDRLGVLGCMLLNAFSFGLSAWANAMLRLPRAAKGPPSQEPPHPGDGGFLAGWDALERTPWLRQALLGFGCVNFFLTPILVVLPLYASRTLGGGASLLGWLEAAVWVGILAGTFSSGRVPSGGNTLRLGGFCMLAMAAGLALPGLIVHTGLFLAGLFCAGCALGVNNVKFVTLFQERVSPQRKGSFFALMQALLTFTFPAAFLLFGLLAERISPPGVCLVQAAGIAALSLFFFRLSTISGVKIEW